MAVRGKFENLKKYQNAWYSNQVQKYVLKTPEPVKEHIKCALD